MHKISVIKILEDTTVDGPGFRTAVYCAGCSHHCPGCHNPGSWDKANGTPWDIELIAEKILADPFADVTFTGGDPMFQAEEFAVLARLIKERSNKNIWCYTGFTFEQCMKHPDMVELLKQIDVLVDGRFEQALRDESLYFRGSSNQRLIDVASSLAAGRVRMLEYNPRP